MKLEGFPETVKLRDGTLVTVRPVEQKDGQAVLEFYRALPEEDRLFLDQDVTKQEIIDRLFEHVAAGTGFPLLAEHDGKIIARATLYRDRYGWSAHVGRIRVVVARSFQRKGLGLALARIVVRLAINLGLDKMIGEIVDNQVSAKRTFEHLGFHQEAVLRGHVKDIHGAKRDLVILANDVTHIWELMETMVADFSPTMG